MADEESANDGGLDSPLPSPSMVPPEGPTEVAPELPVGVPDHFNTALTEAFWSEKPLRYGAALEFDMEPAGFDEEGPGTTVCIVKDFKEDRHGMRVDWGACPRGHSN